MDEFSMGVLVVFVAALLALIWVLRQTPTIKIPKDWDAIDERHEQRDHVYVKYD